MSSARTLFLTLLILSLAAFSIACDDGGDGDSDAVADMGGDTGGGDLVAQGKALYEGALPSGIACNSCHGDTGAGDGPAGTADTTNLTTYTGSAADIENVLANGSGSMPAYADLSADQVAALVAYVQFLGQ